jgi:hypothetical protein
MNARAALLATAVALAASGCAQKSALYHWGTYDESLYRHYKNPQEREAWVESLKTAILEAEQDGRRVAPGLYAEYGYALYEEGKPKDSIVYFEKEKTKWPESRPLMEKMIHNAERRAGLASPAAAKAAAKTPASSTRGPAGALEKTR